MSTHQGALSTPGGFFGLPSTPIGRAAATVFLVGIVLVLLMSTVIESAAFTIGNLNVVGAVNFLVMLAALVTGAVALIRYRDLSWAVWLATIIPATLVAFELVEQLLG
ncbi:MAG: hypothetical protein Q8K99_14455 [Actinomycetota bacterium]|nr:hypothetical protein [Actinomycetota bacterium]